MKEHLSETMLSNLYTMVCSGQKIPDKPYQIPDEKTRHLRARLILEEALETIRALGGTWIVNERGALDIIMIPDPIMEDIIDGCCDAVYVCIGTLAACGVPDLPHLKAINFANNSKFPNGQGIPHPTIGGKFGKPPGWTPPDHALTREKTEFVSGELNLQAVGRRLAEEHKNDPNN